MKQGCSSPPTSPPATLFATLLLALGRVVGNTFVIRNTLISSMWNVSKLEKFRHLAGNYHESRFLNRHRRACTETSAHLSLCSPSLESHIWSKSPRWLREPRAVIAGDHTEPAEQLRASSKALMRVKYAFEGLIFSVSTPLVPFWICLSHMQIACLNFSLSFSVSLCWIVPVQCIQHYLHISDFILNVLWAGDLQGLAWYSV